MRSAGVLHADTEILVPFFDVDTMHVVWHGHYVKYLEVARCALLDQIGHNYTQMSESGYAWPIIDLQLRYVRGAVFGQRLNVRASLVEWENRLKINYLITDLQTGERLTRAVLLFSALWLLGELARGQWWTGFPWGAGGYAHTDGPLAGLAPFVGVYGIGAVAAAIAVVLGGLRIRHALQWQSYGAVALFVAVLWITHQPQQDSAIGTNRPPVSIELLQGNISQGEKFQPSSGIPQALSWYAEQLQASQADMVIAPETAIPVLLRQMPDNYWPALQERFSTGKQAALIGVPLGDFEVGYTNSMVGLAPGQPAAYRYDKHHLVPFGEFIPPMFRWFTDLMQIPLGDFNRGGMNQPSLAWAGERWAPNICYEDLFGEELATRFVDAATAPTILVNASNIAWFGGSIAIDQHLQISRMRSLELARPMIRATNTGATAVINHRGQVEHALPHQTRAVLQAQVQGVDASPTLFARWAGRFGLWPLWLAGFVVLAGAMLTRQRQ